MIWYFHWTEMLDFYLVSAFFVQFFQYCNKFLPGVPLSLIYKVSDFFFPRNLGRGEIRTMNSNWDLITIYKHNPIKSRHFSKEDRDNGSDRGNKRESKEYIIT